MFGGLYSFNQPFLRNFVTLIKRAVTSFWNSLKENGHIRKTSYGGWYCVQDETFLTERQIVEDTGKKLSTESGHPVEWCEEENYVFKMETFHRILKHGAKEGDEA